MRHEAALAPRSHTRDEGGSLRAALQGEALNRPKLLEVEKPQVVSVGEKAYRDMSGMDQEGERKANQWKRRNRGTDGVKSGVCAVLHDEPRRYLLTA